MIALSKVTDKASLILDAVPQELVAIRDALTPPLACAAAKIGDVEALKSIQEMASNTEINMYNKSCSMPGRAATIKRENSLNLILIVNFQV